MTRFLPATLPTMRLVRLAATVLAAASAAAAAPAAAQTLDFESVATNAAGFNAAPFTALGGYTFEGFGVATAASFGAGANASSGTNFAYAFGGLSPASSFVYRADGTFTAVSAALSFRALDGNLAPALVTVRGYRGADEVFSTVLTLTNTASVFALDARNVEELEFETAALGAGGRAAVLAVDDLQLSAVPEPATVVLLGAGGVVLAVAARRRRGA